MTEPLDQTDRQRDGLRGPVRSTRTELVEIVRSLGTRRESEPIQLENVAYDAAGRRLSWELFGEDGAPERRYVYAYDDAGRRTSSVAYGPNGSVLETCEYFYGDDGSILVDTVTDARRTPGVQYRHEWSDAGPLTKVRRRDDGTPGRSEVVRMNRRGHAVEMSVFKPDGSLDHKWEYHYDRAGLRTAEISYWPDGSFRSKELRRYGPDGNEYKVAVYRPDGALSAKWAYRHALDRAGNWTRRDIYILTHDLGSAKYRLSGAMLREIDYF